MTMNVEYSFKGIKTIHHENHNYLCIGLVGRYIDGKFDKFIPIQEFINEVEGNRIKIEYNKQQSLFGTLRK